MTDTATETDPTPETTPETPVAATPAAAQESAAAPAQGDGKEHYESIEEAWNAQIKERDAKEAAEEAESGRVRDDKGRFVPAEGKKPEAAAKQTEAPAEPEAPPSYLRRSIKVDGKEEEIDFDERLKTDEGWADLKTRLEKGSAFDAVVERRQRDARQEGYNVGRDELAEMFREAGVDFIYHPRALGAKARIEIRAPAAPATAPKAEEPPTQPRPATDPARRAELRSLLATETDAVRWQQHMDEYSALIARDAVDPVLKRQEALEQRLQDYLAAQEKDAKARQEREQAEATAAYQQKIDALVRGELEGFPPERREGLHKRGWQVAVSSLVANATHEQMEREVRDFFADIRPKAPATPASAAAAGNGAATPQGNGAVATPQPRLPHAVGAGSSSSGGEGADPYADLKSLDDPAFSGMTFRPT